MKLLLSYRETARLLGIGRGPSLQALIKAGMLRPVSLLGRSLIPREQVESLARSGDAPSAPQFRAGSTKAKKRAVGSIADIDLDAVAQP